MASYKEYSDLLFQSIRHIFRNFVGQDMSTVLENPLPDKTVMVSVDMTGSLKGELIYHFPHDTIKAIMDRMSGTKKRKTVSLLEDVAGEISNMVTGTFINHLQFIGHEIEVTPPEIQEGDEEYVRSLYENVSLSLEGDIGFFDVDFYYREVEEKD